MNQIPLPTTIKGSVYAPKLQEYTINLIYSGGKLCSRPSFNNEYLAFRQIDEQPTARATFRYRDNLYAIFNERLHESTPSSTVLTASVPVQGIPGETDISVARGFNGVALAAGVAGNFFLNYNNTTNQFTSLTTINDPDLPDCIDVTRLDGRFIWTPRDGSPLLYSEVNDAGNVQALSFFDAETSIDRNLGTVNIRNDLFVLGEDSIERFRNVGTIDAPFVRVNNSIISVGYAGALIETKDSFMFLGRDKDGGYGFFVYANGTVVRISDSAIDEELNLVLFNTDDVVNSARGERFNWAGADCYIFTILGRSYMLSIADGMSTWSYASQSSEFRLRNTLQQTSIDMRNFIFYRGAWFAQNIHGLHRLTSNINDEVYTSPDLQIADVETQPFIRGFQSYVRDILESVITPSSLELNIEGISTHNVFGGAIAPTGDLAASLSVSQDGLLWTNDYTRDIGTTPNNRMKFQPLGGLGRYEGYMGVRVSSLANANYTTDNIVLA